MTTNYFSTFITIAPDSPATSGTIPPTTATPTIAALQYALLTRRPYELTSDDVLFEIYAARCGTADDDRDTERERYGWGIHHDEDGRVALIAVGTPRYDDLTESADVTTRPAMRSTRAR
jgi:hypothetical protein